MPSALSIIGALALVTTGALAAEAWEHHPLLVDRQVPAPVRWVLPASLKHLHLATLAGERDAARAAAATALVDRLACQAAQDRQSRAASELAARGQAAAAGLQRDLASARGRVRGLEDALTSTRTFRPAGDDECARYRSLDDFVRGQLLGLPG